MKFYTSVLILLLLACRNEQPIKARVTQVHGSVRIESSGNSGPATVGQVLSAKDSITTDAGSSIDLTLQGGSVIRVQSDTRLSLDDIGERTKMRVEKGGLLLGLTKQNASETFQVDTPTAVASVRGTSFAVSTEQKSIAVLTGTVEIQKGEKSMVLEPMKEARTGGPDLKSQKLSKESAQQLSEILEIEGAEKLDDFAEMQKNWATVAAENSMDYLPARKINLPSRESREK